MKDLSKSCSARLLVPARVVPTSQSYPHPRLHPVFRIGLRLNSTGPRLQKALKDVRIPHMCRSARRYTANQVHGGGDHQISAQESPHGSVLPPTVNWFIEKHCNYACKFCFATFSDIPSAEVVADTERMLQVPAELRKLGAMKMTFVGGEPLLHPALLPLLKECKAQNLTTCVVTNASLLDPRFLEEAKPYLDWLTMSIDASSDELHSVMGRGLRNELHHDSGSGHLERCEALWPLARKLGYDMKLNTVVSSTNVEDDMSALMLRLKPDRWKIFKVLPIAGQNDGALHTDEDFERWLDRHAYVRNAGIEMVPERNDQMTATYVMLDARGRFFTNVDGRHDYGPSGFEVGWRGAWEAVGGAFDGRGFLERGGAYEWSHGAQSAATQNVQNLKKL